MLCVLILYISGGTYSLKSTPNDRIFLKNSSWHLITHRVFARKLLRGNRRRKTFRILFWCLAWGSNPDFSSNKPTHYLLDHGDFFFFQPVLISWMVTLSSCLIWQIISFILPSNEYGCVYAWTTLGNIATLLFTILPKKHLFRWSSFRSWRICKQTKLSHLGHSRPARIHWKADWCGFWSKGIIEPFFFENEQGEAVTINGGCYRAILNEFLFTKIEEEDIGNIWFQHDSVTCHIAEATFDVVCPVFDDRIISRRAVVVWPPWGTVKDNWYANKPETINFKRYRQDDPPFSLTLTSILLGTNNNENECIWDSKSSNLSWKSYCPCGF